jgi:hypothetical protein
MVAPVDDSPVDLSPGMTVRFVLNDAGSPRSVATRTGEQNFIRMR